MPIFEFTRGRSAILTVEQATDVILHCTEPSQDAQFAEKYPKVTASCITQIRRGYTWVWLRIKLQTGWRP